MSIPTRSYMILYPTDTEIYDVLLLFLYKMQPLLFFWTLSIFYFALSYRCDQE